ncbi:type II secretion system protein [Cerasicoccus arenae]|uniref:Prepilin-type N-terminal cleavage/methylation domain-containing protein n=1 Tax=Cerasicoccus arenae TaxID=424488 RepID=A0A8J3DCW7_9BACT|nr:prepilin-type N-terminal cleavage/methylation domain-containing protein [Cerasicoccus arenae]MBK1858817.1 prepilin-type N-terminal cleavage/methylation domain-containing protein [Cerasicoccus arenae]GHC04429.1 hypothetical protein GCM10007047_21460 [Cerasicoccus arenae]
MKNQLPSNAPRNELAQQRANAHHCPAQSAHSAHYLGFTLVEVMVVVVIIGLLAIMAMPAFQKARLGTQNSRMANDLRIFKQGFENYNLDRGVWPQEVAAGVLPTEMAGFLAATVFEARTVVGGRYDWNFQNGTYQAGIAIAGSFMDDEQATNIDSMLDDGNLSTGGFQGDGGDYVLILMP